ncbi:MAG: two-component sensor histidine kinase [Salinivirgaceae bacterium]|nr:two-component sensor histidine kinase [Salinivirgaceae bacterium]
MIKIKPVSRYRRRLFYNFFFIFVAFAFVIAGFQYQREKQYKIGQLENTLDLYVNLVNGFIIENNIQLNESTQSLQQFIKVFPQSDLRITIISKTGEVLFDSFVENYGELENHFKRPEVQGALHKDYGKSIRKSSSTGKEYYYYGVNYTNYIARAALPYNIQVENYLKVDSIFILVILFIFIVFVAFLIYMSDRFGKSIATLQQFALKAVQGEVVDNEEVFPDNELGIIGKQIVQVYNKLQKTKKALSVEREKLFRHLQIAQEGIAIFTKEKKHLLANNHFIQFINTLSDKPSATPDTFFNIKELKPITDFIDSNLKEIDSFHSLNLHSNILSLQKNGKYYVVQAIVFKDSSFEISISDVTKVEKEKKLKQQMTSNIAHELKTPVSSILGYLETILNSNVEKEKQKFFLERSYIQTQRLSSLIQDMSLLNKIEEASDLFPIESIGVLETVVLVADDLHHKIEEKKIKVNIEISEEISIQGNKSVFYSIWRNLLENAVNYAGNEITITISNYLEDEKFLYFSFADNGPGIPEEHLTRIFERFYRVDSGRARSMGGTGLGLAIVKNGVMFHKGEISVKNVKKGGLEFIFSICKDLENN